MSNFEVSVVSLIIEPHPNADALELAVVGGYRAVVRKGVYSTGDYALYIPEAAVLPPELIEELGLAGMLGGSAKNRVRAVRLRGELSQGIVCRPESLQDVWSGIGCYDMEWPSSEEYRPDTLSDDLYGHADWYQQWITSLDFAETLGIVKYQPKVPSQMRGKIREQGTSEILPWIEIPNIKKKMNLFSPGEPVYVTEKIHGTHMMCTLDLRTGLFMVSSKGLGKQGFDLVEEESNLYWQAVRKYGLEEWMRWYVYWADLRREQVEKLAIYGEVYGEGIQDLGYGTQLGYRMFDIRHDDKWLSTDEVIYAISGLSGPVYYPPLLYSGSYDYETIDALATGSTAAKDVAQIREGVVVRPATERRELKGGYRVIAKFISPAYLLRKGANVTEFE